MLLGTYWTYDEPMRLGWTWGTALITRREAVEEVGTLCEDFFMYGEDVEWCLRMGRHGWEIWFCPEAEVLHHGSQSSARRWQNAERERRVSEGYYRAVALHRGQLYVRCLRAANALARGISWLASWFKGRQDGANRRQPQRPDGA